MYTIRRISLDDLPRMSPSMLDRSFFFFVVVVVFVVFVLKKYNYDHLFQEMWSYFLVLYLPTA
jgi:hypothetical protein